LGANSLLAKSRRLSQRFYTHADMNALWHTREENLISHRMIFQFTVDFSCLILFGGRLS